MIHEQQKIKYKDIMDLGFSEEVCHDGVYLNEHGFDYCIITKYLTKKIYLDWAKETKLVELVRVDCPRENNIVAKMPVTSLEQLKQLIKFFTDEKLTHYSSFV
jgi:hypothetical protein